jgi:hypothetical protein
MIKKFFILTLATIATVGCGNVEVPQANEKKVDPVIFFDEIYKFKYEEHSYIYFQSSYGRYSKAGVVHNPECEKCLKK